MAELAGYIKPRIYIKKMPNKEVKGSFVNMRKIGAMLEGDMGREGVSITGLVLSVMNDQIESSRKRKNPIGKHDLSLEPWRLTAGRNLIKVLIESVDIKKDDFGNTIKYTFVLGRNSFLKEHAPYWRMLNYGGKISINATGVPGYFGAGQQPSGLHNDQSFHWTGSSSFIKKKDGGPALAPTGTKLGLMIPKKHIVGINYIGAGYQAYLSWGKNSIIDMKLAVEEAFIGNEVGTHPTDEKVKRYEQKMKILQAKKDKLIKPEIAETIKQKAAKLGMTESQYYQAQQRGIVP